MTHPLTAVSLVLILIAACNKDGSIPAYVQLDTPSVVDYAGHTVSSKVTDAWVYVNDQPVGVWQVGRRIPLIGAGSVTLKVIAGVRNNGVTDDRIQYPFYASWVQQVDLVPEQAIEIAPQVHYYPGLNIWLADFEAGNRFDTLDCTATLDLVPSDSTLLGQGGRSGSISLDSDHSIYRGVSGGDPFVLTPGASAYLEMDYRSDTRVLIGVRYMLAGVETTTPYAYAAPTGVANGGLAWNKVYIDVGTPWAVPGALDKRFYIEAQLPDGATTATVEVDNVKLVQQ